MSQRGNPAVYRILYQGRKEASRDASDMGERSHKDEILCSAVSPESTSLSTLFDGLLYVSRFISRHVLKLGKKP
ncbi:hypothetical protein J31TS4_17480 [Paenibacillus sp. J31TS4]|nr:hypothetical protein J31TS4_17480 [Paenibacillus sp. J31TS4]